MNQPRSQRRTHHDSVSVKQSYRSFIEDVTNSYFHVDEKEDPPAEWLDQQAAAALENSISVLWRLRRQLSGRGRAGIRWVNEMADHLEDAFVEVHLGPAPWHWTELLEQEVRTPQSRTCVVEQQDRKCSEPDIPGRSVAQPRCLTAPTPKRGQQRRRRTGDGMVQTLSWSGRESAVHVA